MNQWFKYQLGKSKSYIFGYPEVLSNVLFGSMSVLFGWISVSYVRCVHRCWFSPSAALRGRASRILIFKYFCAMMTVKQSVCISEGLFINNVIICLPCPWCVWYKLSWLLYVFFAFFIHFWTRKTILFRGTFVSKHQMALSSMNYSICTLRVTLFTVSPQVCACFVLEEVCCVRMRTDGCRLSSHHQPPEWWTQLMSYSRYIIDRYVDM